MSTVKEAKEVILTNLESQGWSVSKGLKVNHATNKQGQRVWFKALSLYYSNGTEMKNARSLHYETDQIKALSKLEPNELEKILLERMKYFSFYKPIP